MLYEVKHLLDNESESNDLTIVLASRVKKD